MEQRKNVLENKELIEEILSVYIELYFSKSKKTVDFYERLISIADCYVFGGFIVDFLQSKRNHRDIDIVVDSFNPMIDSLMDEFEGTRNSFGGYKLTIGEVQIDIWEVKNTWAIRKMNYMEFDLFSILPSTSFFNSTAIIYSIRTKSLAYKNSFIKYINNGTLDILFEDNPYPELCIIKSYQNYKKRTVLSKKLKTYITQRFNQVIDRFESTQIRHFGKIEYSTDELINFYLDISDQQKQKRKISHVDSPNQLVLF